MGSRIEVLLTPADYLAQAKQGMANCACVVLDVLRATSVIVTGLANGATGFMPVSEIAEAVQLKRQYPEAILAGEREGLRITARESGGADFDLGNSPREFAAECVSGRIIITTTTNGTRALRACASAPAVAAGAFLNLAAVARWVGVQQADRVLLVCAGTGDELAFEDVLAAGAICDLLKRESATHEFSDSAHVAWRSWCAAESDLEGAVRQSNNGRRLWERSEFRADVNFCLQRDVTNICGVMQPTGMLTGHSF